MSLNAEIESLLTIVQRNFGFMSIVGFSCTLMITWEGLLWYAYHPKVNSSQCV